MAESVARSGKTAQSEFIASLGTFAQQHKARHWTGTFGEFLEEILPHNAAGICRTSHQYVWDMLRWKSQHDGKPKHDLETNEQSPISLFSSELFGVDEALERIADYFKAASAGSEVGRRLLLLLGPPSGGLAGIQTALQARVDAGRADRHPGRDSVRRAQIP